MEDPREDDSIAPLVKAYLDHLTLATQLDGALRALAKTSGCASEDRLQEAIMLFLRRVRDGFAPDNNTAYFLGILGHLPRSERGPPGSSSSTVVYVASGEDAARTGAVEPASLEPDPVQLVVRYATKPQMLREIARVLGHGTPEYEIIWADLVYSEGTVEHRSAPAWMLVAKLGMTVEEIYRTRFRARKTLQRDHRLRRLLEE